MDNPDDFENQNVNTTNLSLNKSDINRQKTFHINLDKKSLIGIKNVLHSTNLDNSNRKVFKNI